MDRRTYIRFWIHTVTVLKSSEIEGERLEGDRGHPRLLE